MWVLEFFIKLGSGGKSSVIFRNISLILFDGDSTARSSLRNW